MKARHPPVILVLLLVFNFGFGQYFAPFVLHPRLGFGLLSSLFNTTQTQARTCLTFDTRVGTCVDYFRCVSTGGSIRGKCNLGFKSCCYPISPISSGNLVKSGGETSDSLTINRISRAYCQVRVDFSTFSLENVDRNGTCVNGRFTASGQQDVNVPSLCGTNSGQHMYLNFDTAGTPITLNLVTQAAASDWNIRTTQIACSDTNAAPAGCLQYYSASTGNVKSFNYIDIDDNNNRVTYQPANLDYIVCIANASTSFNTITWTRDTSSILSFTITSVVFVVRPPNIGSITAADFDSTCMTDFVGIPNGQFTISGGTSQTASKFCGLGFPARVVSTPTIKPFTLRVFTNADEISILADMGNVGFSLNYVLS